MAAELPTGTVTFLFSDIEGSTSLLKRLGETYGQVLADHQTLLRQVFERTGGLEIDTQGDAFFVVFSRAKDAVAAALQGQRALREFSWPESVEVKVRMGMHTGEPSVTADRYIGLGVHRTARICAAGHGGQVLLSQSSYAVLVDDVLPDIGFRDLGEHRLKDLDRPERIYQLSVPDLQSSFPPLNSLGTVEPFAGRERELEEIVAATTTRERIGVVVADDSALLREGLCRLMEEAGFEVTGRAADAEQLVALVAADPPAVAITDIRMPPTHTDEGLLAAELIRRDFPGVGVLVLSQYLDASYAARLLEHYPERVGYLLKDRVSDIAVLADAVRRVAEGECVVDPTIVSRLMRQSRAGGPLTELSPEERELLTLSAEGFSDEAIAERVGRPQESVEAELRALFEKLGATGANRTLAALDVLRS